MSTNAKSGRVPLVLIAVYAVSQANIARLLWPLGLDVIRLQTTTNPAVIRQVASGWTSAQRAQYRRHLAPDTVHPLLYGAVLIIGGQAVRKPSDPGWLRWVLAAAPITAAACDLIENAFHVRFCTRPDGITTGAATLSGAATRTKWVLALGCAALIAFRVVRPRRTLLAPPKASGPRFGRTTPPSQ